MSGIHLQAQTGRAVLTCDARNCDRRWQSQTFTVCGWRNEELHAAPAFAAGWRVYVGGRGRMTYCPEHGPTVPMRLILGREDAT